MILSFLFTVPFSYFLLGTSQSSADENPRPKPVLSCLMATRFAAGTGGAARSAAAAARFATGARGAAAAARLAAAASAAA
jgi:hypothetical protein